MWAWLVGPALLYVMILLAFDPGIGVHFFDRFLCDERDGFVAVWNIWWTKLRNDPRPGAVLDGVSSGDHRGMALYHATVYERPMAVGHISRTPTSVSAAYRAKRAAYESRDFETLSRDFGVRFVVLPSTEPVPTGVEVVWKGDAGRLIYLSEGR